jgi:hypothetical protein
MAAVAVAPLIGPVPAAAQWIADDPMPPQAAARVAARHGFTGLAAPRLVGDVYIVPAIDEDGARVRLVIDAYNGRILRPLGASAELAPPRPVRRLRPWDYTPAPEAGEDGWEREPVERSRERRWSREELVPPRPIGRAPSSEPPLSREAVIDLDRERLEASRERGVEREQRPAPATRGELSRRAASVEPPLREPVGPTRPRMAAPSTPAPSVETPARPAEAKPTPKAAKPAATAAVPAPAVPKDESPPVSPTAPAGASEKPASPAQAPAAQQPSPGPQPAKAETAEQPAATASAPASKVRVIGGVTPVVPQSPTAEEGSSSEPSKVAQ